MAGIEQGVGEKRKTVRFLTTSSVRGGQLN